MASDARGLLDALAIPRAHVVGVSMGGMIGQLLTARHPDRVRSFVSIMSTSGDLRLPGPRADLRRLLLARAPAGAIGTLLAAGVYLRHIQVRVYVCVVADLKRSASVANHSSSLLAGSDT